MMNVLAICSLALLCIHVSVHGEEMGPFELSVISSGRCPPESNGKDLLKYESKLQRTSRSYLMLKMNISFQIPFDDKMTLKLVLAKFTNQGWKDNYFQLEMTKPCSVFKEKFPDSVKYLEKQMKNPPEANVCLPAGNYPLLVRLNHKVDPRIKFFYNKYRARLTFLLEREVVFCNEAVVDVLPHNG